MRTRTKYVFAILSVLIVATIYMILGALHSEKNVEIQIKSRNTDESIEVYDFGDDYLFVKEIYRRIEGNQVTINSRYLEEQNLYYFLDYELHNTVKTNSVNINSLFESRSLDYSFSDKVKEIEKIEIVKFNVVLKNIRTGEVLEVYDVRDKVESAIEEYPTHYLHIPWIYYDEENIPTIGLHLKRKDTKTEREEIAEKNIDIHNNTYVGIRFNDLKFDGASRTEEIDGGRYMKGGIKEVPKDIIDDEEYLVNSSKGTVPIILQNTNIIELYGIDKDFLVVKPYDEGQVIYKIILDKEFFGRETLLGNDIQEKAGVLNLESDIIYYSTSTLSDEEMLNKLIPIGVDINYKDVRMRYSNRNLEGEFNRLMESDETVVESYADLEKILIQAINNIKE